MVTEDEEFETPRNAADRSVTDLLPPELAQLGKDTGTVIEVFSSAKSTMNVTATVHKVLDVLLPFGQGD